MDQITFAVWKCMNCGCHWGIEEGFASCDIYDTFCPECGTDQEYKDNISMMQFKEWKRD